MITLEEIKNHDEICEIAKKTIRQGPWSSEPNRVQFKHAGFECLLVRNPATLFWCGYVGVPKGHKFYEKEYDDLDIDVHGGLTYSNKCNAPICHFVPDDKLDDLWWFGFDCGHAFDLAPMRPTRFDTYRDEDYVIKEVKRLADQLYDQT